MEKCAQNSENSLTNTLISIILNNVNTGICFYQKKPTIVMRLSLEESIIENMPFAELVAIESEKGRYVLEKLQQLSRDVINCLPVNTIKLQVQGE